MHACLRETSAEKKASKQTLKKEKLSVDITEGLGRMATLSQTEIEKSSLKISNYIHEDNLCEYCFKWFGSQKIYTHKPSKLFDLCVT